MTTLIRDNGEFVTELPSWMPEGADDGGRLFLPVGATEPLWLPDGAYYDERLPDAFAEFSRELLVWPWGFDEGRPVVWDAWQMDRIVRPLLGARWEDNDRLSTTTMFFSAGRGSSKTTLAAALGLFGLTAMGQRNPTVDLFALSREQADRLWQACDHFVRESPQLAERLAVHDSRKRIVYDDNGGLLQARTGVAKAELGLNSAMAIIDELLAQKSSELYDVIHGGRGKRPEQIVLALTTPSPDVESFARDEYRRAKRVAEKRKLERYFLPVIFECDPDDDPFDESVWPKANPGLENGWLDIGVLRELANAARLDPLKLDDFKVYRMALWADAGSGGFVKMTPWDAAAAPAPSLEALQTLPCYMGIDTSAVGDVTSQCLMWPVGPAEMYVQWRHWITEAMFDDLNEWTQGHMKQWRFADEFSRAMELIVVEGDVIPMSQVVAAAIADCQTYGVWGIGIDSMRSMELRRVFSVDGPELPVQLLSAKAESMKASLERASELANRSRVHHTGDPFARWMLGNARVKYVGEFPALVKQTASERHYRIDAASAFLMAVDRRLAWEKEVQEQEEDDTPFVWALSELAGPDNEDDDDEFW